MARRLYEGEYDVIDYATLYQLGRDAYEHLWATARQYGSDVKLYLHWTACPYNAVFEDYHINIGPDGELRFTGALDEIKSHTWKRNSGAIGIAIDGCTNANTSDLGDEPPTEAQIEAMAKVIAVLANALDLTIDLARVMTHGEAADNADGYYGAYGSNEEYGPLSTVERWDLQYLGTDESPEYIKNFDDPATGGNVLRGKANWYRNYWKENPSERPY